jgi:hypothetical protein
LKNTNKLTLIMLSILASAFFISCEGDTETIIEYRDPDLGVPVTSEQIIGCWQYDKFSRKSDNDTIWVEDTTWVGRTFRFREDKMGWGPAVEWAITDDSFLYISEMFLKVTELDNDKMIFEIYNAEDGELYSIRIELSKANCPFENTMSADMTGLDISKFESQYVYYDYQKYDETDNNLMINAYSKVGDIEYNININVETYDGQEEERISLYVYDPNAKENSELSYYIENFTLDFTEDGDMLNGTFSFEAIEYVDWAGEENSNTITCTNGVFNIDKTTDRDGDEIAPRGKKNKELQTNKSKSLKGILY